MSAIFIIFGGIGVFLLINNLLMRKYPKLRKLNDRLNKRFANHKDDTNPATGLPMMGGIDIDGNPYGTSK